MGLVGKGGWILKMYAKMTQALYAHMNNKKILKKKMYAIARGLNSRMQEL
jgi:hypothetical protein